MLKGKTAVVTGGSRGIGKAICLKFAENGADIAFLYAGNTVKAEETLKELEELGVKAKAYQCNVADADAVAAVVKEIVKDYYKAPEKPPEQLKITREPAPSTDFWQHIPKKTENRQLSPPP